MNRTSPLSSHLSDTYLAGFSEWITEKVSEFSLVYCLLWEKGEPVYLNTNAASVSGLAGKIKNPDASSSILQEDQKRIIESIEQTAQMYPGTLSNLRITYQVIDEQAHSLNFEEFLTLQSNTAGYPVYVQGIALCVSEEVPPTSHPSQNLALLACAHIREGIMVTDADLNIIHVNQAFEIMNGYPAGEILGKKPNILTSGRQNHEFYHAMWETLVTDDFWEGELWNRRQNGDIYPALLRIIVIRDNSGNIENYMGISQDITERHDAENQIQQLAHYDPLTRLANRVLLEDRVNQALAHAERERSSLALLFVDLDHFKNINDSLGHFFGDRVLKLVAERMESCLSWTDTLARLGGDEFVVVCPGKNVDGAREIAQQLLETLAKPYPLGQVELTITASIGISLFPQNGSNFEALLKHADTALFRAKSNGRNGLQFFSRKMNVAALERLVLQNSLRQALDRKEFVLLYQPQIDVQTRRIVAAEALIRWRRSSSSLVMPRRFMGVAEESGLIVLIGEWVLIQACRQLKLWQEAGLAQGIRICVNISASQFAIPDFDLRVAAVLAETGVEPSGLELELTETVAMADVKSSAEMFQRLRALGVGLSIDDFGTGYSSLAYLKRFPIDRLKIDQSLIRDIADDEDDLALAEAVISLAHVLRLPVVAEGVETANQFALLAERGCDIVQGYYFSRPLDTRMFAAMLKRQAETSLMLAKTVEELPKEPR